MYPAAGATAVALPVTSGATRQMVQTGEQVFRGRLGSATCTGCHGSDGTGTPLGPDLTAKQYLWGDGSYESIARLIKMACRSRSSTASRCRPWAGRS